MELLTFQKWMLLLLQVHYGWSICYFPGELQGKWATQVSTSRGSRVGGPVMYQDIDIHYDMVLQWGNCHERVDNNVILSDNIATCFRCISLNVVSPRVVQVWTLGINACYTSETEAFATCPPSDAIRTRHAHEIMLYKRKSEYDEPQMPVECPLNGRYRFTYRRGGNSVTAGSCDQPTSEFSNCPYGFGFNVEYNNCPYAPAQRTDLQCLGSWVGEDGNDYLAVMDTSIQDWDTEPIYKCGMFREEAGTGRVFLAFSEDSTCINNLTSPTHAFETYVLTSHPSPPLPPEVTRATCKFPQSLAGHWHHTYVDDDTVVFKDYVNYKSYSASCVQDMNDGERYIVYTRSHCGEWSYNCLWLKRRAANVLEFMLGLYDSETFDPSLCDYAKFGDMTSWTTQGKSLVEEPTSCPIVGTYAGELPDAKGICAQLYSDCESPQIMYYTMSECWNNSAVYERGEAPVSEAGPWVPGEHQVSTGAVFTVLDEGAGRGRRQAGQFRVANARTTTISWLWGSSASDVTTTTTPFTSTTPSPRTSPPRTWSRPEPPRGPAPRGPAPEPQRGPELRGPAPAQPRGPAPATERGLAPRGPAPEPQRGPALRGPAPLPTRGPAPAPPRGAAPGWNDGRRPNNQQHSFPDTRRPLSSPGNRDQFNPVGFWPSTENRDGSSEFRPAPPPAQPPAQPQQPVQVRPLPQVPQRPQEEEKEDGHNGGVPGRATWIPGAPPGFHESTSQRPRTSQRPHVGPVGGEDSVLPRDEVASRPIGVVASVVAAAGPLVGGPPHHPVSGVEQHRAPGAAHPRHLKQEREYQCLGQWEEEGRLYAFTYRRDIKTYECFVGVIKSSGIVFIKEAGQVCSRGVQPEVLGMKLSRKEACTPPTRASQSSRPTEYIPQPTRPPWFKTTKPWKPITAKAQEVWPCKVGVGCGRKGPKEVPIPKFLKKLSWKWGRSHKPRDRYMTHQSRTNWVPGYAIPGAPQGWHLRPQATVYNHGGAGYPRGKREATHTLTLPRDNPRLDLMTIDHDQSHDQHHDTGDHDDHHDDHNGHDDNHTGKGDNHTDHNDNYDAHQDDQNNHDGYHDNHDDNNDTDITHNDHDNNHDGHHDNHDDHHDNHDGHHDNNDDHHDNHDDHDDHHNKNDPSSNDHESDQLEAARQRTMMGTQRQGKDHDVGHSDHDVGHSDHDVGHRETMASYHQHKTENMSLGGDMGLETEPQNDEEHDHDFGPTIVEEEDYAATMDSNTSLCSSTMTQENLTMADNLTDPAITGNCSKDWALDYDTSTESPPPSSTTDDSDIPNIPISILQYPTPSRTTAKPSMLTLPPMIWKPLGEPGRGRPRKPHSGSAGRSASPVLLFMVMAAALSAVWRTQV